MGERRSYIALEWVIGEIEETLVQAREAFNQFVLEPEDVTQLQFCLTYTHQVFGSLTMVELPSAALLASEVELVLQDLLAKKLEASEQLSQDLLEALFQISAYLQHVKNHQEEKPQILVGLVDTLRAYRQEDKVADAEVFNPTLALDQQQVFASVGINEQELIETCRKSRQQFQAAMVGLLRQQDEAENLVSVNKVVNKIYKLSAGTASELLWQASVAAIESFEVSGLHDVLETKAVLRKIDSELKRLLEEGRLALESRPSHSSIKVFLYPIAKSSPDTALIRQLQNQFKLQDFLADNDSYSEQDLVGADGSSIESVVNALNEELDSIQDSLDQTVRQESALDPDLLDMLWRIANTLTVLGANDASRAMMAQRELLSDIIASGTRCDNDTLMQIAEEIVQVQGALQHARSSLDTQNLDLDNSHIHDAREALKREARAALETAKQQVVDYVASQWSLKAVAGLDQILAQVAAGLDVLELQDLAAVARGCQKFVMQELQQENNVPQWHLLDTLADALTSIEYYLECMHTAVQSELDNIYQLAKESVEMLGVQPLYDELSEEALLDTIKADLANIEQTLDPQPQQELDVEPSEEAQAHEEDIAQQAEEFDPEVIEIFVEEAADVAETLEQSLPVWQQNLADLDVLQDIRRGFHTLKGSGRMVGASDLGEMAWAVENMLNRVLDGGQSCSQAHYQLVNDAFVLLPDLVEAFEQQQPYTQLEKIDAIKAQADLLAQGEPEAKADDDADEVEMAIDAEAIEDQVVEPEFNEELNDELDQELNEEASEEPQAEQADAAEPQAEEFDAVAEPVAAAELQSDDDLLEVDAEVAEIFVEEAEEVTAEIDTYLPQWQGDLANGVALAELRRAFHTLKGSGRMVNANVIGELAWAIENLLNKVIDGELVANEQHPEIVTRARNIFPALVNAFEQRVIAPEKDQALALAEEAHAVAKQARMPLFQEAENEAEEQTLLAIFAAEADGHLQVINQYVSEARQAGQALPLSEALQRALHTLKGSAFMAEVIEIAELVSPLEKLIKELRSFHVEVDEEIIEVLAQGAALVEEQLLAMSQGMAANAGEAREYIASVEALYDEHLQAENARFNGDNSEAKDALKHATSLLLDGMEKLCHASDIVASWAMGEFNSDQLNELNQDLENLHQVAEEAEFDAIALLARKLIEYYQAIDAQDLIADEAYLALAQTGHDGLIDMMDTIAIGQVPVAAESIMQELQLAIANYSPAAVAEPEPETGAIVDAAMLNTALAATRESLAVVDAETLDIFREEAQELIEDLEDNAASLASGAEPDAPLAALNRDLHTLKGGARLTELKALGDWAHDYETFLEQADFAQAHSVAQLKAYQAGLRQLVELVMQGLAVEAPSEQLSDSQDQSFDAEVLEIFLEEASDQQEIINATVMALKEEADSQEHLDEIKRVLHTLKGGARLAGITQVADAAHDFESYLIDAEADEKLGGEAFNQTLDKYQGEINQQLAQLGGASKQLEQSNAPAAINLPVLADANVSSAALQATKNFLEGFEKSRSSQRGPQEYIKVSAELLQNLVNLAGETSISRTRIDERLSGLSYTMEEMDMTLDRLRGQLRRLEIETEAQIVFRMEQVESEGIEGFDPLEMDRYSNLQQLSRSLTESASDIQDVKETFSDSVRDMETILLQQSRINTELQEGLMRSQMVPLSRMVPRLKRIVRQISAEVGKDVEFHFDNVEGELDRTVLERMIAPLEHMLRNAVDHGIEAPEQRQQAGKPAGGNITIDVQREGGEVVISLADDGAGIPLERVKEKAIERGLMDADANLSNQEILQFILHAGFSTAEQVTQISGRGVGMDVVHSEIKQLGGSMDIQSQAGQGTTFFVRLPFTVSVNRALMVNVGQDTYAVPLNSIEGIVRVSPYELEAYYQDDAPDFEYAGQHYQMSYMGSYLGLGNKPKLEGHTTPLPVILVRNSEHAVAIQVDRLLGSREVVVKSLGPQFSMVEGVTGATVLGDGGVVVIVDLLAMIRNQVATSYRPQEIETHEPQAERRLTIMVTDDSVTVRKVTSRFLERHGMDVLLAKDGLDAVQQLQELDQIPDLMLLDIEMPRMDGFEVATRVRHSDTLKHMPIIMITSRTGEKHRERALSLGVSKYLGKPYQEAVLLEAIEELTGQVLTAE